ncbi:MAG: hypothetical protein NVS2B14_19320 [Chamaesiphon sp.]
MSSQRNSKPSPIQLSDWPIEQLPGLSDRDQSQLFNCDIKTTGQLVLKARTPASRQELANCLHVHIQYVNKWVALAELACIPSVGCRYCGLLLHAGICSVIQLSQMPPHRLHQQVLRLQIAMMQRRDLCPSLEEVCQWIKQAQAINVSQR